MVWYHPSGHLGESKMKINPELMARINDACEGLTIVPAHIIIVNTILTLLGIFKMSSKILRKTIYLSKIGMRILNSQAIKHTDGNVSEYLDRKLKEIDEADKNLPGELT